MDLEKRHFILVLLLQFCGVFVALAQEPYYWHLTDEDGLPSMTVYEIQQAKNGLIWMATANGICSYDGKKFQRYNSDKLNDSEILKIRMSNDGIVWGVNLTGQLFYVKDNQIQLVTYIGDYQLQKVGDFEWLGDDLWLSDNPHYAGSYLIGGKKEKDFSLSFVSKYKFKNIHSIIVKPNEVIVADGHKDFVVYRFDKNLLSIETLLRKPITGSPVPQEWRYVLAMIKNQNIYVSDNNYNRVLNNIGKEKCAINSILMDGDNIYHLTNNGLHIIDKNNRKKIVFTKYNLNNIKKDKEGNIWIATNGNGVMIIPSFDIVDYNMLNAPILDNKVTSLLNHQNIVYLGHGNGNLSKLNICSNYSPSVEMKKIISGRIFSIKSNNNSILLNGDGGIVFYNPNSKEKIILNEGQSIKSTLITGNRRFFLGSTSTFFQLIPENFDLMNPFRNIPLQKIIFKEKDTKAAFRTYGITEDPKGTIWIGSVKGVYTYSPNGETKPFLPIPYAINYMTKDKMGRIWIASSNNGVFCVENGAVVKVFNLNNGLPSNCVNTLTSDDKYVWIGTNQGVVRCDLYDYSLFVISKYNGLPTDDIISLASVEQNLLVGTDKGLIRMPFSSIVKNEIAPQIEIKSLIINEKAQSDFSNLSLNYDQNNLNVEFIAYAYKCKGNVTYQYRLVGIDDEWVTTQNREVRFANLSAGDYTFEVVALNEYGVKSNQAAQLTFSINAPFWKKWWFYFVLTLLSAGIFSLIVRQRYKREQEKREIEQRFQQKIDDLRMQALQSQMNPHFIFNALNAIQHFLTTNDDANATKFLARFARLIRLIFEHNSKKEISLAEEFDMLNVYLSLEKLRFGDKVNIDFSTVLPPKINEHSYYLPPLLIQPIIENAFKHGLFHKKTSGNLHISFHNYDEKYIACIIEDNGIGRVEAQRINAWRKGKHTSSGLASTQERIKIWHLQNQQNIPNNGFIIEDLYENDQITPKGTKVTIIF